MADEEQGDAEQEQVAADGFRGEDEEDADEGGDPLSALELEVEGVHVAYPGGGARSQHPGEGEGKRLGGEDGDGALGGIAKGGYGPAPDAHLTEDSTGADVASVYFAYVSPLSQFGDDVGEGDGAEEVADGYRCQTDGDLRGHCLQYAPEPGVGGDAGYPAPLGDGLALHGVEVGGEVYGLGVADVAAHAEVVHRRPGLDEVPDALRA